MANWRAAWRELRKKESAVGPIISRRVAGRPLAPMEDFAEFSRHAYQNNVIAYRCIKEIAEGVASVPFTLFAGEEEARADHPVYAQLARPNPMQGYATFVAKHISYYLLSGNCYLEAVGPTVGPPKELYTLRPDRMKVVPGSSGIPQGYTYGIGHDVQRFEVDPLTGASDIRHMKTFNPLDDWYGMSPVQAAAIPVNQFNESGRWNQNLLKRGASRGGGLEFQEQNGKYTILDDVTYKKLMDRLEEQYSGADNAGRPRLYEGGVKFVDADFSPQDMDWLNAKHTSARDICGGFGFPCQLLGIPGDNTYSNYKEARQALFENTVIPLTNLWFGELNVWLLPRYAEGLTLKADEDQVLALAPRREALWDRVGKAEWISIQEKRAATQYEPWEPTGDPADDLYITATSLPLGFSGATSEEEYEKELRRQGVPERMILEFKRLAFGQANGEWRIEA